MNAQGQFSEITEVLINKIDSSHHRFLIDQWGINYLTHELSQPEKEEAEINKLADSTISSRIRLLDQNTPLDFRFTSDVRSIVRYYLGKKFDFVRTLKSRSEFYFPLFEAALDRHGLPMELKYIPIIESGLNPRAKSPAGATGLWQFMHATGKMQGLEITSYIDQRMDPYLSTDAACRYFKRLYKLFGND